MIAEMEEENKAAKETPNEFENSAGLTIEAVEQTIGESMPVEKKETTQAVSETTSASQVEVSHEDSRENIK